MAVPIRIVLCITQYLAECLNAYIYFHRQAVHSLHHIWTHTNTHINLTAWFNRRHCCKRANTNKYRRDF